MLKKIPYEKYNLKEMKKNIQQSGFSILINMINYKCEKTKKTIRNCLSISIEFL